MLAAALSLLINAAPAPLAEPARPEPRGFPSRVLGRNVPFDILVPPGYTADGTNRFPVLYWLPDLNPSASNTFSLPPQVVHNAIRQRILPPLFVVYVRTGAESFYTDATSGLSPAATTFVHELIPTVDLTFRTLPDRQNRAIQGVGRGGFGALRFALTCPDVFGSAASYAGAFHTTNAFARQTDLRETFRDTFGQDLLRVTTNHPAFLARANAERLRHRAGFRLVIGMEDGFRSENRAVREAFQDARLPCEWSETRDTLAPGQPLPSDTALEGLEFAASWLGAARAADRDGPWINTPERLPPRLRHHVVFSEILERPVGYALYLPPDHPANATNVLPVVYHLHGRDEDESRHLETTGYLDVALSLGETPPFAWAWLYGGRSSWFMDSPDGRTPSESVLLDEVIPHVEARWSLGGSPSRRAIDGWGMGGFGAARFAARNPPFFGAALLHHPVLPDLTGLPTRFPDAWMTVFNTDARFFSETEPFRLLSRNADALRPLLQFRIVAGERSPHLQDARRLRDHLDALRVTVEFEQVPSVAGSGPDLFRQTGLRDIRFLGKAVTRPEP